MIFNILALAKTVLGKRHASEEKHAAKPHTKSNKVRLFAILPVLVAITALILSVLCLYAGHTPGYMEDYALFTLNTSRIGQNIREELDHKITEFNFNFKFKRSDFVPVVAPAVTPTPTTLITLAPRGGIGNAFSSLTRKGGSEIDSANSAIHSDAHSLKSKVESKANSVKSAAESEVTGTVGAIETDLVHLVNKAFNDIIQGLNLHDWTSVHIMTSCEGEYQLPNGNNITVGQGGLPPPGTSKHVDSCSKHSAVDPLSFLNVFYWIGVVLTGITMVMGFVGLYMVTPKLALFNILATVPAFCIMGLSSALAHGVAVGVPKLIDFIGGGIGIDGVTGQKFLQLTWATVVLLFINMVLWGCVLLLAKREREKSAPSEKEMYATGPVPMHSMPPPNRGYI